MLHYPSKAAGHQAIATYVGNHQRMAGYAVPKKATAAAAPVGIATTGAFVAPVAVTRHRARDPVAATPVAAVPLQPSEEPSAKRRKTQSTKARAAA